MLHIRSNRLIGLALASMLLALGLSPSFAEPEKKAEGSGEAAPVKPTKDEQKRIDELIKQLGAEDFEARQNAERELSRMGLVAAESLRQAAKDPDAEIAARASELLTRMEEQLKSLKQLTPKKVNLKLSDVRVDEAVKELGKQSGYTIRIDDKAKVGDQKVTLDTGDVSFWEAFDQLCAKAGLVETATDEKADSIALTDGKPKSVPTCYVGGARIRLMPDSVKRNEGGTEFTLEISLEPRFRQAKMVSSVRIEGALDENGKSIDAGDAAVESSNALRAAGVLKLGAKQQKVKELRGNFSLEAFTGDKSSAIVKPADNVGKSIELGDGASFQLDGYEKKENGDVVVQCGVTKVFQGGNIVIRGGFNDYKPELTDTKGNAYGMTATSSESSFNGRTLSTKWKLTFHPKDKESEAAALSVQAADEKKAQLTVPFTFKDLTLP